MTKSPEKAEGAKGVTQKIQRETGKKLDEAKEKVGPKAAVSRLFGAFMKDFAKLSTGERIQRIGEIIFVATIGRLTGADQILKQRLKEKEVEVKKKSGPDQKEEKTKANTEDMEDDFKTVSLSAAPANDNALPEGSDNKWTSENLLRCENVEQCRALMKANGFILDQGSGNYINPRWLSPEKILQEPVVEAAIGGRKIRLKRSVMKCLKMADKKMFKETGEHIKVGEHFRSNARQFELFKKLKPMKARVASPGHSFHEIGQAVDLPENWEKAQKYMWAEGFVGGKAPIGLSGDANHFSIGEIAMTDKRMAALEKEGVKKSEKTASKAA